ncbi:MAG TPA: molecular chaperone TorD family protein [Pyrinomonadaceae bacterium]|jgi:TorA maturation chaperone TorD
MELFRALAVLAEPPRDEVAQVAEALALGGLPDESEYTETFVFQLYPYASVYLGAQGMLGGEARDLIDGFWRALGQSPPAEADHLSVMLALYARLVELEDDGGSAKQRWRHARKAFLWEHLLSWLPAFLVKLNGAGAPFYRKWGEVLTAALAAEAEEVGEPETLPAHLRDAGGVIDPREGGTEEFLQSLLAPVRCGMILTRGDLNRAGRALGLGLRMGERKFILRALFGQDAGAVLEWLEAEAAGWAKLHRQLHPSFAPVARFWEERARDTALLLRELKPTVKERA